MTSFAKRHAISRATFFLELAEGCLPEERDKFEAFLEASIVFGRTAIHRLKSQFEAHPQWKAWFASLLGDPSVVFFREHRDFVLKEASPKVGQVIGGQPERAAQLYYFESPEIPATGTVRGHLDVITSLVRDAERRFSRSADS